MKPMRCCHCGRRLASAAGMTERGPVGPVCAVKLGLPRELKARDLKQQAPARKGATRVRIRMVEKTAPMRDPHTLDWISEAATC